MTLTVAGSKPVPVAVKVNGCPAVGLGAVKFVRVGVGGLTVNASPLDSVPLPFWTLTVQEPAAASVAGPETLVADLPVRAELATAQGAQDGP